MTPEQQTVLLIKGTISELPDADQAKVKEAAVALRAVLKDNEHAALAFALVGAELVAEA